MREGKIGMNRQKNWSAARKAAAQAKHDARLAKRLGSDKALAYMGGGTALGGLLGGVASRGEEKNAAAPGRFKGLLSMVSKAMSSKAAKGAAVAGAGALGGGALGLSQGKRTGYDQGTDDVGVVAQKALQIGRQQGAQIGYQYALQQMKNQGK
jgi:hypothetical protein